MNKMALKNSKQKKKYKCCPCLPPPSQQEDVPGEQLTHFDSEEKEARLLCLFGDYLDYLETPSKNEEKVKVKTKKHKKKWKAEKKKKPSLLIKKENMCEANMNDSVLKKVKCLRDSKNHDEVTDCLDDNKREFCKKLDSSMLEFLAKKKGKKAKKQLDSECIDGSRQVFREKNPKQYYKMFKAIQNNQSTDKQLFCPLSPEPYVSGKGERKELTQQETPWLQIPCKSEALDSTVHCFKGSIIKGFKQNMKLRKEVLLTASTSEVKSCAGNTEPLLSSTPRRLEDQIRHPEEQLDMGDPKDNRPSHTSSDPEVISSSFDSQELFITQQPLFPLQIPSSSLPLHHPKTAKEAIPEESYNDSSSSDTLQSSQRSAETETFQKGFQLTPCSLTPNKRSGCFSSTRECAIQTDDFFSSSAVASSLIIKKQFADCHEQPLDLSLPYRIRSAAAGAKLMSYHLEGTGDGIHVPTRCKLEPAISVLDDEGGNITGSQSLKSSDIKYVQMHLNSSYYFKVKGDSVATVSGTPLLRLRDPVSGTPPGKLTLEKRRKI
ncbi:uncharacterized protein LOC128341294 [Hemicordylus capensis]|uniref:uncharacterized protein LOC128341294 n=1 Tax=Hemicordylus capensis TaxID=884348 RepID=UPI0023027F18|nr:uncharacterized protein LOC128341294 [Hemicordylus capensis]XP_053143611.1 uncharacterized protein LOC128341294 [Hemicordylus capensis]XP_053143612.1 uncharacterized protein LOC128341294 [Hemicordylus capensis]XP_053143613.1 uncharacterized protein LOC128341294 [Hemicordylus capensis]XP_053143614.1 uncharacterized protein LOC128341294 [Hemicordylus capensis]XP_053143615.1 uncharacterized protein LOC128341294 [Hemicordylus capensis]